MNYTIEKLSVDNAHEYAYVNSRAWLESYKGIIEDEFLEKINTGESINSLTEKLKGYLINDPDHFFLLRVDGKAEGILCVRKSKYEDYKDYGELGSIYLLNEVKGKGYGKVLFEYAKEELKKMGHNKMVNGCIKGNPTNEFYKHMGGKLVKQIPFIVKNSGQVLVENVYVYESI